MSSAESLLFSINATAPVFLVMVLGYLLRRRDVITQGFVSASNRLSFRVLLPVMLFNSIRNSDFLSYLDGKYIAFCIAFLLIYPLVIWILAAPFLKNKRQLGSFVQGVYRGNTAIIGVSVAQNIYGMDLGTIPLMIAIALVMYNVVSVVILSINGGSAGSIGFRVRKMLWGIATNHIIWGILLGIICVSLPIRFPEAIDKSFTTVGNSATFVSLLAAGGGFVLEDFKRDFKLISFAAFVKLVFMPIMAISAGYLVGFRGNVLFSMLVMAGVSTATTSTVMANELGCDESLAVNILALTTMLASITLTAWIWVMYTLNLL